MCIHYTHTEVQLICVYAYLHSFAQAAQYKQTGAKHQADVYVSTVRAGALLRVEIWLSVISSE